jgi:hypothetical protein
MTDLEAERDSLRARVAELENEQLDCPGPVNCKPSALAAIYEMRERVAVACGLEAERWAMENLPTSGWYHGLVERIEAAGRAVVP